MFLNLFKKRSSKFENSTARTSRRAFKATNELIGYSGGSLLT